MAELIPSTMVMKMSIIVVFVEEFLSLMMMRLMKDLESKTKQESAREIFLVVSFCSNLTSFLVYVLTSLLLFLFIF